MIWLTGDLHGKHDLPKLDEFFETEGKNLTRDDYLIILGDFGMIFDADTMFGYRWEEKRLNEYFEEKYPWTTLFIDGNHENFIHLKQFPKKMWNGGRVNVLTKHCLWLRRGEIFQIEGHTFLTLGGAYSIDKPWRKPLISWWPDEEISDKDIRHALLNLKQYHNGVDYVLTHCAPYPVYLEIAGQEGYDISLNDVNEIRLQQISEVIHFRRWYFGHYHIDREFDGGKYLCMYKRIVPLHEL